MNLDAEIRYQDDNLAVYVDGPVVWSNGTIIGKIYQEVDGYYVFVYDGCRHGFWNSATLRAVADALDGMNRDWDQEIKDYFDNERDEE